MMMMGRFSFVVFSTEVFLDFDDFESPIKSRTKIIEARDAMIFDGDVDWSIDYKIDLHVNEAQLSDNPYQSPFDEKPDSEHTYLTVDKFTAIRSPTPVGDSEKYLRGSLRLADIKFIRQRYVYNLITLVSEISGFADILFVGFGFIMATFYTPYMFETSLVSNLGRIRLPTDSN